MGATKKMIDENPNLMDMCNRPELHWMEQEYLQSIKQKENESIKEIEVHFEVVSKQESEKESAPELGGDGHHKPEVFDNQPVNKIRTAGDV